MRQLQRAILVLLVCVICVLPGIDHYRQHRYFISKLTDAYASYFFEKMCVEGECNEEKLHDFYEYIQILGDEPEFYIEEYCRGFRQDGTEYRIYIPWYEIVDTMQQEGVYLFTEGSEWRLHVGNTVYYGLVR